MGMSAAHAAQTVSLGYAQANVDGFKDLKGVTAKYHYQGDSALGIIGSFTYMGAKEDFYDREFDSHERDKAKYYSLLVGPSYRFNDIVSIYGLAGIGYGKVDWKYSEPFYSESGSEKKSKFAYGVGVQIAPVENWVIDVGYEGTKIYDSRIDAFNVGVGYRF
ncbi:virulence protein [Brenneria nigrifluens]|uniref:Virulence protein n=3 Tax=Pectobacteriaceae TaxID=1903410 RepID=A0A2U1UQN1_9GAMM|nr:virulence-related outer membrane protein [Brenneria sp. EniD312]PWC23957.1 virulence protein [Brenneria nigrifluens] [Brenneria nigrifluens DSM 30175 = ATCC 13028]QCR06628.1 virulence protein [Brenneria nigrifluens] [Brenneria nigrifluens DSM 30175 = ATCC 13028]